MSREPHDIAAPGCLDSLVSRYFNGGKPVNQDQDPGNRTPNPKYGWDRYGNPAREPWQTLYAAPSRWARFKAWVRRMW